MRATLLAVVVLLLSACGFHLRGHSLKPGEQMFAFHSIYVRAPAETPFVAELKQNLKSYHLELAKTSDQADLTLDIVSEMPVKLILALNASGQVSEYELHYKVNVRAYDRQQQEWLPASEIDMLSYFNYDNTQILAKAQEEQLLYQSMRSDAVQQVIRRLSLAKPPKPDELETR